MADQANVQSEEKASSTLDDYLGIDKGWEETVTKKMEKKNETAETKPTESQQETKTGDDKKPCKDCPDGETEKKAPYKVIKVDGKDIPIETEEEFLALAQKGFDYTKKTQEVAEQRKEVDAKAKTVEELSKKFNEQWDLANSKEGITNITTTADGEIKSPEAIKEDLFKKLDIDPELADEDTSKILQYLTKAETEKMELSKRLEQAENITKAVMMKDSEKKLVEIIEKTEKDFPLVAVMDENGNNLTSLQVIQTMIAKSFDPEHKKKGTTLPEMAIEAVKEVHRLQQTGDKNAPKLPDKLEMEDLEKNYPDLVKKIEAKVKAAEKDAVAAYARELDETAPGSPTARVAVEKKSSDGFKPKKDSRSGDIFEDAFSAWEKNKNANA